MAPPRRRKAGSFRIDAALAAMRPMGFPDSVVRKRVRELLKVYGAGDEGWYFIEECSYKLLIETLLEDGHRLPKLESPGNLLTDGAGSSEGNGLDESSEQQDSEDQGGGRNSCLKEIMHKTAENHSQDDTELTVAKPELQLATISVPIPMDLMTAKSTNQELEFAPVSAMPMDLVAVNITEPELDLKPISVPIPIDHVAVKITNSKLEFATSPAPLPMGHVAAKRIKSEQDFSPSPVAKPMHRVAAKRIRKPCYGWISDDDTSDDDFILLRPAATGAN